MAGGVSKEAVVVGSGLTGLMSAFHLERAGFRVEIVEKARRPGGLVSTLATPWGPAETAANGVLCSPALEEMAEAIGLELLPALRSGRKRYIFRHGRPRQWPLGPFESAGALARFFSRRKKRRAPRPGETIAAWGDRVLGPVARRFLLSPALQGIYAGDPAAMSASLILGRFFREGAEASGARPRLRGTVAPRGGMGELVERLTESLKSRGVRFRFGQDGQDLLAQASPSRPVVLAASAREAEACLRPAFPKLAALIGEVRMLPLAVVSVFLPSDAESLDGFGCLFPPSEGIRALGVLVETRIFSGRGPNVHERWILGGSAYPETMELSDEQLRQLVLESRSRLLGPRPAPQPRPLGFSITRWPQALPHYDLGLERILADPERGRAEERGLFLMGNYTGSLGLSQILERARELPLKLQGAEAGP